MAGSQIPTSVTILNSLKGYQAISLNEYNTSAAASIAAGSVVEIAGAFFTFLSDEAINASSWTSIVTGTTAYITLTPSGTAGSQIVDVAYTATAPTWRDDHQGWYASAASNVRVIGSVYKAEAANYGPKFLYDSMQDSKHNLDILNVRGKSTLTGLNLNKYYFSTTSTTFSFINNLLLPQTPSTNSTVILSGKISMSAGTYMDCYYAVRSSPTSMTVYGFTSAGIGSQAFIGANTILNGILVW